MYLKCLILTVFIFACLITLTLVSFGQDSPWQKVSLSKDVSIDMPTPVHLFDTLQLKIANSNLNDYWLQAKLIEPSLTVRNGDELVQAYESFLHGYLTSKETSMYTNVVSDTSFGVTDGKWIHSTYAQNGTFWEMFTYAVLINSHFYLISFASGHQFREKDRLVLSKYLGSLSFAQAPIREYSDNFRLQSRSFRFGERLGRYVIYFVLLCIVGLVIYFASNRLSGKKSRM
jgi:hypothetical protein